MAARGCSGPAPERRAVAAALSTAPTSARNFALMRADDLIFHYVVNNWLLGDDPPAFDILAWNVDATNLPAASTRYARLYAENGRAQPGGVTVPARHRPRPGRLRQFVVAGADRPHHALEALLHDEPAARRPQRGGGHLDGPHPDHRQSSGKAERALLRGPRAGPGPRGVAAEAAKNEGIAGGRATPTGCSSRSGDERDAPSRPGSRRTRPLRARLPGRYVKE